VSVIYLTREGQQKLKEQLDYLVKVRRKEIAKALETARAFGDLRENAEYETAKTEQSLNEIKIKELAEKLTISQILDDTDIPKDKAYLGATVRLRDLDRDEEFDYMLVSDAEADFMENKISVASLIGKALLGHTVNETIQIQVPAGLLNYQILSISR
jgi:transcription elongation factor GreA